MTNPGNDADTGLSLALAKATISAAYLLLSNSETLNVNSGTYAAENTSATTRMHWLTNFATVSTIQAIDETNKPIIYGGALNTYSHTVVGGKQAFIGLVFRPNHTLNAGAGNTTGIMLCSTSASNLTYTRCEWSCSTVSGAGATPQGLVYSGTGPFVLTLTDCIFTPMSDSSLASFATNFTNPTNGVVLTATGISSTFPKWSMEGCVAGTTISNSAFAATNYAAFFAGKDADGGGAATAGVVTNCTFTVTGSGSHGALIGHGANGVYFINCRTLECGDYGLVMKSCESNFVIGGSYLAGAGSGKSALLYKGSTGNTVTGVSLFADGSSRRCVFITANDVAQAVTSETLNNCRLYARNGAELYLWAAIDDGAGNRSDRHLMCVQGGTFGTVYGTSCTSLSQLRQVWNSGDGAGNDQHSTTTHIARHRGLRNRRQRLAAFGRRAA